LTGDREQRAYAVFREALERDGDARSAFLDDACSGDGGGARRAAAAS